MARFVEGVARTQSALFSERLEDGIGGRQSGSGDRVLLSISSILAAWGLTGFAPRATGRAIILRCC